MNTKLQFLNFLVNTINKIPKVIPTVFVDLDGTLVLTDKANKLAYQYAFAQLTGEDYKNPKARITRDDFISILDPVLLDQVINLKSQIYCELLNETQVNTEIVELISSYQSSCFIYLITASKQERADITIQHHGLDSLFHARFYCPTIQNKYSHVLAQLPINKQSVFVFENDILEADKAFKSGIPADNICLLTA